MSELQFKKYSEGILYDWLRAENDNLKFILKVPIIDNLPVRGIVYKKSFDSRYRFFDHETDTVEEMKLILNNINLKARLYHVCL